MFIVLKVDNRFHDVSLSMKSTSGGVIRNLIQNILVMRH